jgi:hypothetical protein
MLSYRAKNPPHLGVFRCVSLLFLTAAITACAGNKAARELASSTSAQIAVSQNQFKSAAKLEASLYKQLTRIQNLNRAEITIDKSEYLTPPEMQQETLAITDKNQAILFEALKSMANKQRESIAFGQKLYTMAMADTMPVAITSEQDAQLKRLKEIKGGFDKLANTEDIVAAVGRYAAFAKEVDQAMDDIQKLENLNQE